MAFVWVRWGNSSLAEQLLASQGLCCRLLTEIISVRDNYKIFCNTIIKLRNYYKYMFPVIKENYRKCSFLAEVCLEINCTIPK